MKDILWPIAAIICAMIIGGAISMNGRFVTTDNRQFVLDTWTGQLCLHTLNEAGGFAGRACSESSLGGR